jgi:uncharacterized membrane protein
MVYCSMLMTLAGMSLLLIPAIGVIWLLRRFEGFKRLSGDRPWYKDIWKPIAFLSFLSLLKTMLHYWP